MNAGLGVKGVFILQECGPFFLQGEGKPLNGLWEEVIDLL